MSLLFCVLRDICLTFSSKRLDHAQLVLLSNLSWPAVVQRKVGTVLRGIAYSVRLSEVVGATMLNGAMVFCGEQSLLSHLLL